MQLIEQLETRRLLANFTASTVAELIADMNAANAAGGSNAITLKAGATFNLTAANSDFINPTGLPVIGAGNDLTIVGNGDTIQRSAATGTPAFRLFAVAAGGALSINQLTIANGLAFSPSIGTWGEGGAIDNKGTLSLTGVTVQNCIARGQNNYPAYGGGIYSSGVLTIADSAIINNQALGGDGYSDPSMPRAGNTGLGGGLFVSGGTAILINTTVSSNLARGGNGGNGGTIGHHKGGVQWNGGNGGDGFGGGIYAYSNASVSLRGTNVSQNAATGGTGGSSPKGFAPGTNGIGEGGGIYIASGASVSLDSFTVAHTSGNTASTSDNDIFGSFTLLA